MEPGHEHRENTGMENLLPPWPKGVSGNPGGRPKGRSITAQLRKLIDEGMDGHDIAEALAKTGIKQALKGDFRFWNALIDRIDGGLNQHDDLAKRIADDIRNRPALAPPPPPGAVPPCDGPAAVQDHPGGAPERQDDDEQTKTP